MTITLTPDLEEMVRRRVESGDYEDSLEVVRDALLLMDDRDSLNQLRAAVAVARAQVARGEVTPYSPELMARIRRTARERIAEGRTPKADVLP